MKEIDETPSEVLRIRFKRRCVEGVGDHAEKPGGRAREIAFSWQRIVFGGQRAGPVKGEVFHDAGGCGFHLSSPCLARPGPIPERRGLIAGGPKAPSA